MDSSRPEPGSGTAASPDALRRSWRCGLRSRILLTFLPSIIPLIAIILGSYLVTSHLMRRQVGYLSRLVVRDGTSHLNDRLRLCRDRFEEWIGRDNKDRYGLHIELNSLAVAGVEFTTMLHGFPEFVLLLLTDPQGRVLTAYAPGQDPRSFLSGEIVPEARLFSDISGYAAMFTQSDLPERLGLPFRQTYVFGIPTRDSAGQVNGFLLAYVDWTIVTEGIRELSGRFHQSGLDTALMVVLDRHTAQIVATCGVDAEQVCGASLPHSQLRATRNEPASSTLLDWLAVPVQAGVLRRFNWNGAGWNAVFWPLLDPGSLPLRADQDIAAAPNTTRGTERRALAETAAHNVPGSFAVVALIPDREFRDESTRYLAMGVLLALVGSSISAVSIWLAGGRIAERIQRTVRKLKALTEGEADLSRRMPVDSRDELGELAASMNAFLGRLETIMAAHRDSEERYRRVSELTSDFAYAFRREPGGAWNPEWLAGAVTRITGMTPDELHQQGGWAALVCDEDHGIFKEHWNDLLAGRTRTDAYRIRNRRQDVVWVMDYGQPVCAADSAQPMSIYGAVKDITQQARAEQEKRILEEHLRQSQKLEAIGQLAGGVAHDFNNLLTGILGYANLLHLHADSNPELREAVDVIEKAAWRASQLTSQLLGFARRGKHQDIDVDLHRVVMEVVTLLGRTRDKRIVMIQRFAVPNALVRGDPGQIHQVVMNLAVNACDAVPAAGGEVTFATSVIDIDADYCRVHPDTVPGLYTVLAVSDTGVGIAKDIQNRIFEPFFSTKKSGTGMGLATSYGIVRNHGGWIQVYSEEGRGSTFRVYLPLSPSSEAPRDEPEPGVLLTGGGRILVVDDEDTVRRVVNSMLRRLGFDVVMAENGQKAVEYYGAHAAELDLVLLDMTMPVMNGADCFRRLRQINPELRAVLSTGHALDGLAQELLEEGMCGFVQKPYVIATLSRVIAAAMKAPIPSVRRRLMDEAAARSNPGTATESERFAART